LTPWPARVLCGWQVARIAALPQGRLYELLPWNWSALSGLSGRLKQLDEELLVLGEGTMLLEELEGFIAGLLVCPDLIKPGEWLPIIWNRNRADRQPAFDNLAISLYE
jgi:Uncharacterised protein family (UPF0149)